MEIKSNKATNQMPPFGLWMGAPKVGKSTFMAGIDNALVVDFEKRGYDHIDVEAVTRCESIEELFKISEEFFNKLTYDVLILDHLREITSLFSSDIAKSNSVKMIEAIGFGKGTGELKHDITRLFKYLSKKASQEKRVYIVAHTTDRNGEVRLDVDGKNETMILGLVDFVGYLYRSGPELWCNFSSQTGAEFGCRNKNLAGFNALADYSAIMEIAKS